MISFVSRPQLLILVLSSLGVLSTSPATSQTSLVQSNCSVTCEGDREIHNTDSYSFNTYTRKFQRGDFFVFQTCVENKGDKDLQVNWFIPGPDNWIPKSCSVNSNRERTTGEVLGSYRSCLRYGNSWKHLRANFLPHVTDKHEMEADATWSDDCSAKPANVVPPLVPVDKIKPIKKSIEFFAPGSIKSASQSLTKFFIELDLFPVDDNKIVVQNIYYKGQSAYLDNKDFTFTTFRVDPPESMKEYFIKSADGDIINKDGTFNLNREGKISVSYAAPAQPALLSSRYTVYNEIKERVGSITIPIWTNSNAR